MISEHKIREIEFILASITFLYATVNFFINFMFI